MTEVPLVNCINNVILQLNGVAVNPGLKRDGVEIRKAGRFVLVDWDFGLTVRWDGEDR